MRFGKFWWCASQQVGGAPGAPPGLPIHDLSRVGQARWTCLRVRQASFVSLLVCFHFFFLLLSVSSVRRLRLDLIAIQMRRPCRLSTGLAIFKFFVGDAFRLRHCTMIIESVAAAETRQAASLRQVCPPAEPAAIPVFGELLIGCRVRHRFRATFSRQPRQVRKEATVTGSFVCSGPPVPDFYLSAGGATGVSPVWFWGGRAGTPGSPLVIFRGYLFRHDQTSLLRQF